MTGWSPTLMPTCRVVVADDDGAIRELVTEGLIEAGYLVDVAADGEEALRRIEQHVPDVLLLDMRMPRLSGWEVAHALRERAVRVPIVVMTSAISARGWAEEIGAAGYLGKPFDLDDLIAVIGQFC